MRKFLATNLERDAETNTWRWIVNLPVLTATLPDVAKNSLKEGDHFDGPTTYYTSGTPDEAGISLELVRRSPVPLLGVCLGHQALGQAFGGKVVRAPKLMHGKTSEIRHDGKTIFAGLPDVFTATRYHSLVVAPESVPDCLEVSAWTDGGVVMGLRHRERPLEGVQFHPESILTSVGKDLLRNFLRVGRTTS